jgi:hypothetical protein
MVFGVCFFLDPYGSNQWFLAPAGAASADGPRGGLGLAGRPAQRSHLGTRGASGLGCFSEIWEFLECDEIIIIYFYDDDDDNNWW